MDSLIGYGSDDDVDSDRCGGQQQSTVSGGGQRRRDDDTNYDDVNMDMSEDSQGAESEPELPPADPVSSRHSSTEDRRSSGNVSGSSDGSRSRSRGVRAERSERRWRHRDDPPRRRDRADRTDRSDRTDRADRPDRNDRSERSDDRPRSDRSERGRSGYEGGSGRRGLLGDRPDDSKVPALMDLKPFGGEPPPGFDQRKSHDARDAVSPRFNDRDRRERERDRDRHSRRSEERSSRASGRGGERRERSRSRGAAYPPSHASTGQERRSSPSSGEYRPSSYKVNKKLEVMEKMGLQIKTPDGMMATAQQLRQAASEAPAGTTGGLPSYYNAGALNTNKVLDQVQKRKLLWSNKSKCDADEAAKWSGTRFAQDSDGKQVSKFMRLMGIKEPAAVKPESTEKAADPIKKQEELFQAMQAQYEVARATTHTMRGVGLGFQRGQY